MLARKLGSKFCNGKISSSGAVFVVEIRLSDHTSFDLFEGPLDGFGGVHFSTEGPAVGVVGSLLLSLVNFVLIFPISHL